MLKNHIKIAWRNLQKNKGYFVINTLGLSVALCVAFLMLLWVQDEYQVDAFHEKDAQLYRVKRTIPLEGGELDVYEGISYPLLAQAKIQIPEIEIMGALRLIGVVKARIDLFKLTTLDV